MSPLMIENRDRRYADLIRERCSSGDYEGNGSQLDLIVAELLRELGMPETVDAFDRVGCWRA